LVGVGAGVGVAEVTLIFHGPPAADEEDDEPAPMAAASRAMPTERSCEAGDAALGEKAGGGEEAGGGEAAGPEAKGECAGMPLCVRAMPRAPVPSSPARSRSLWLSARFRFACAKEREVRQSPQEQPRH
jgi:hypothetical protein